VHIWFDFAKSIYQKHLQPDFVMNRDGKCPFNSAPDIHLFQNSGCAFNLFGAYIFRMVISWLLCQHTIRDAALPGTSSVSLGFCGVTISLLMTKAIPAELAGRSGSRESNM